ncbi:hypothetical protein SKAU_G00145250 [Synaphobranchus kaupii]|uniref:Uncharacterized protein n=1 Tax=Synaphobranchus kaupii TaxID=118154 RepID=A0A9Q1FTH2_SYNKA|nr:hypothetical protein SKAU_G00145250 [Synaphobranchus kaupii]
MHETGTFSDRSRGGQAPLSLMDLREYFGTRASTVPQEDCINHARVSLAWEIKHIRKGASRALPLQFQLFNYPGHRKNLEVPQMKTNADVVHVPGGP